MMDAGRIQQLVDMVVSCGAYKAAYLPADQIVLDRSFRDVCATNRCGSYGKRYSCPPALGDIEELMRRIRSYDHAVLYQSVGKLEDSFDIEGMQAAGDEHSRLCQRVHAEARKLLPEGFLHLSAPCRLCERCAKMDDAPCRHPDLALGAMEGYGTDVYNTAKNAGLNYINGKDTVTYFGMLLFRK